MGPISPREAGIALIADPSCDFADRQLSIMQHPTRFLHANQVTIRVGRHTKSLAKSFRDVIWVRPDANRKLFNRRSTEYFPSIDCCGGLDCCLLLRVAGKRRDICGAKPLICATTPQMISIAFAFKYRCLNGSTCLHDNIWSAATMTSDFAGNFKADKLPTLELNIGLYAAGTRSASSLK